MTMAGWGQEGSAGIRGGRGYQTEGQGWDGSGRGGGVTQLLTFGWEPSAMVEREKLSLCSSDGVRYLQESSAESRNPHAAPARLLG